MLDKEESLVSHGLKQPGERKEGRERAREVEREEEGEEGVYHIVENIYYYT